MKKAVVYLRVSTDEQVKGASLDTQLIECQRWLANNSIVFDRSFRDEGFSAKTLNRPGFKEMMAYLDENKKEVDYVVCYQTDRFSRNSYDFFVAKALLKKLGIEFKNINSPLEDNATENFMVSMQAILAEYDNRLKADRTLDNMKRQAAASGYRMHKAPYGLRNVRDALGHAAVEPVPEIGDKVAYYSRSFQKVFGISVKHYLRQTTLGLPGVMVSQ